MAKVNIDIIKGKVFSAYAEVPFDEGKEALEREGYRIISLEENARLRMREGKDSFIFKYGNWTREGVIYIPKKGIFLTKNSPVMQNPKEATDCHRRNKEFYLTNERVENALADSVELNEKQVPTNRFGDNEITVYAFGSIAKQYGEFLRDAGIKEMPVWLEELQDKPFVRQLWFGNLDIRSGLLGTNDKDLDSGYGMRGVRASVQGTAKNIEAKVLRQ